VFGGILVGLQQGVQIVDNLGDHFGILGAEIDLEGVDRDLSVIDVLGVKDFTHRRDCTRVR
jgi:hypothetical protein